MNLKLVLHGPYHRQNTKFCGIIGPKFNENLRSNSLTGIPRNTQIRQITKLRKMLNSVEYGIPSWNM